MEWLIGIGIFLVLYFGFAAYLWYCHSRRWIFIGQLVPWIAIPMFPGCMLLAIVMEKMGEWHRRPERQETKWRRERLAKWRER